MNENFATNDTNSTNFSRDSCNSWLFSQEKMITTGNFSVNGAVTTHLYNFHKKTPDNSGNLTVENQPPILYTSGDLC